MNTINISDINRQVNDMYLALDAVDFDKRVWLVLGGPTKLECAGCYAPAECDQACWRYKKGNVAEARLNWARNALEWLDKAQELLDNKGT